MAEPRFFPVIPNGSKPLKVCRYRKSKREWRHMSKREENLPRPTKLKLVTWNVQADGTYPGTFVDRMKAALDHIWFDILKGKDDTGPSEPCCVLLQEVTKDALGEILETQWVQDWFFITPIAATKWPSETYGNVTLVEKNIKIVDAKIVEFAISQFHRAAIVLDLRLRNTNREDHVLRIINGHLESLAPVPGTNPRENQMELCAFLMSQDMVSGGVLAGDMNALSEFDDELPKKCGLRDAWWRTSEKEKGYTWGIQGGHGADHYPPGRFDKILFTPQKGFRVEEPRRIGIGVKTEEGHWASDHFGLVSRIHVL